ncbi:hypothetical protein GCM10028796_48050 [Ramlibacter monticola]|uniref:DUF2946 family protein n=1 Tax=Ramlibacter monticola TaxID=1926872 RepID=A0A937CSY3_9BURK|nr:DUF2946 family protein [Ramlibacter monticola]MBL0391023.1 DUF2946 family protein [Ramlibacter monticola]
MESLRRAHRLARLVLAWFVLSVGVAVAAPALQTQGFDVVCSGGGGTKLMAGADGDAGHGHDHTKDCRMCVLTGLPSVDIVFAAQQPPVAAPAPLLPVVHAAQAASPYPARAPPLA